MEDLTTDIDSTEKDFEWSNFGKAIAVESATAFAISAASIVGFFAVTYAASKITEIRTARRIKAKNLKADPDQDN